MEAFQDMLTQNQLLGSEKASFLNPLNLSGFEFKDLVNLSLLCHGPKAIFIDRTLVKRDPLFVSLKEKKGRISTKDKVEAFRNKIFRNAIHRIYPSLRVSKQSTKTVKTRKGRKGSK